MFGTLYSQIGVVLVAAVLLFALLKGDEPERAGAGIYALGMLASLVIQSGQVLRGPQYGLMAVDMLVLAAYAGVAWKSRRTWPVWASAFQALVVVSHIFKLANFNQTGTAFTAVVNIAGLGILVSLAIGAFWAWQERRASQISAIR